MQLLSMILYQVLLSFRHIRSARYCYKQDIQVKLHVFYHVISFKSAAGLSGIFEFFETFVY